MFLRIKYTVARVTGPFFIRKAPSNLIDPQLKDACYAPGEEVFMKSSKSGNEYCSRQKVRLTSRNGRIVFYSSLL